MLDTEAAGDVALEAAEGQDASYRMLFESNPQPMWIFDSATLGFLDVNEAATRKYGYSRDEFLAMTTLDIRPADERLMFQRHQKDPGRSGCAGVWRHRLKNGQIIQAEIHWSAVHFQGRAAELIVANDITSRLRAESGLALRYALTRVLSESPADACRKALRLLCNGLEFEFGELWRVDPESDTLRPGCAWQAKSRQESEIEGNPADAVVSRGQGLPGQVWASGCAAWSSNVPMEGSASRRFETEPGLRAGLAFPTLTRGEVNGVVLLLTRREYQPDDGVFELMADIGSQIGEFIERRRTLETLRRAEEDFRKLFEEAPIAYHEIDREGRVVRVNRAECEFLGIRPEERIGRPVWDFVAPEEQDESRTRILRRLAGEQIMGQPMRTYVGPNGMRHEFEIYERPITNERGEVAGMRTAMLDVTAARRAQRTIAYQAELLNSVDDAIFGVDRDFRVTYMNRAAEQKFGWKGDEALGQDLATVAPANLDKESRDRNRREGLDKGHWKGEMVYRTWQGEAMTAEVSGAVNLGPDGEPHGAVLVLRDLSERKRAEEALRTSEARLKLVQSAAGIGVWDWDVRANKLECSEEVWGLFGEKPPKRDPKWELWEQYVHPEDRGGAVAMREHYRERGGEFTGSYRVVWRDGSVHALMTKGRSYLDESGEPMRMLGATFDITEQQRMEEQVRILSMAMEQSPVSIVITDLKGNIEYANGKTSEITGYSREELIGRKPNILKSGETSTEEYRNLWKTIQQGTWKGIFHNKKKNGELFWEAATICPIRDAEGVPTHYLAVKEDISAQKLMQAALRISEERFRIAAQHSADAIYEWDIGSGRVQTFGSDQKRIRMLDEQPPTKKDFLKMVHPEDRQRVAAAIQEQVESGKPYREEYRVIYPQGEVRYWSDVGSAIRDERGRAYKWIGVTKDITELKAAERANAELAAIVESADVAIISKDLSGTVLTWNAGAERIYGYSAEEMQGRKISILAPLERSSEEADIAEVLRRGGRIDHLDTLRLRKNGESINVLLTICPIRDRFGKVTGAAHISWDVSEHKRLQRQLVQAQKLESIGSLAAGIAHEINTPIQYIGDNAKFLEEAFGDLGKFVAPGVIEAWSKTGDETLRKLLEPLEREVDLGYLLGEIPQAILQLQEGVEQVARIVRAMKEFSHPGAVEKTPLDINRAIESTLIVSRNEWKYAAELTTELDKDLPLVPCLAGEFNQVMLNLIVNAAHAIGDVVKETGAKGSIHVTTRRNEGYAEIRVSDTGTGIPEAIQGKVFDPFFTTKEVGKGTGQGLAIAHSVIVQKHGGRLTFETEQGVGTTFIIQLPLAEEAAE